MCTCRAKLYLSEVVVVHFHPVLGELLRKVVRRACEVVIYGVE